VAAASAARQKRRDPPFLPGTSAPSPRSNPP
jgi:hypothetical protein